MASLMHILNCTIGLILEEHLLSKVQFISVSNLDN